VGTIGQGRYLLFQGRGQGAEGDGTGLDLSLGRTLFHQRRVVEGGHQPFCQTLSPLVCGSRSRGCGRSWSDHGLRQGAAAAG
jgi:hypothetical protein